MLPQYHFSLILSAFYTHCLGKRNDNWLPVFKLSEVVIHHTLLVDLRTNSNQGGFIRNFLQEFANITQRLRLLGTLLQVVKLSCKTRTGNHRTNQFLGRLQLLEFIIHCITLKDCIYQGQKLLIMLVVMSVLNSNLFTNTSRHLSIQEL